MRSAVVDLEILSFALCGSAAWTTRRRGPCSASFMQGDWLTKSAIRYCCLSMSRFTLPGRAQKYGSGQSMARRSSMSTVAARSRGMARAAHWLPNRRLPKPLDVRGYVTRLEEALIVVCTRFGVEAGRVEGRRGVWTSDGARKLAAIGIRVRRAVTMHGFALNCDCDLSGLTALYRGDQRRKRVFALGRAATKRQRT